MISLLFSWGVIFGLAAPNWPKEVVWYQSPDPLVIVSKKDRRLLVLRLSDSNPQVLFETEVDLGRNPGDKKMKDDHRTPEGIYVIQQKLSPPNIPFELYGQMAFTLDYPNPYDRLLEKSGSGIWLHAVPDTASLTRGSRGCVVMRNQSIQAVEPFVRLGLTPVLILDQVKWVTEPSRQLQQSILNYLTSWVRSWESQNLETYAGFYHVKFVGLKSLNYHQWLQYKGKLFHKYSFIRVEIKPELILKFKNHVLVRARQRYESDQFQDEGIKFLHWIWKDDSKPQILAEDFLPSSETLPISSQADAGS